MYLNQLRQQAKICNFCEFMTHTLLLDRIGMGTNEEGAPKEAITNLTLDKCIDVIRASKTTASRLKMMNEASNKEIKRKNPLNRSKEIRIVLMNLNVSNCVYSVILDTFLEGVFWFGENVLHVTNTMILFLNACQ